LQNYLNQKYWEALNREVDFVPQSYYDSDNNTMWLKFDGTFGKIDSTGLSYADDIPSNIFLDGEPLAIPEKSTEHIKLNELLDRFVGTWNITKYDAVKLLTWMVTSVVHVPAK